MTIRVYIWLRVLVLVVTLCCLGPMQVQAQKRIRFVTTGPKRMAILAGADSLALFWYDDTLRKPYLHQVYAPGGQLVTRGYPLLPRPEDTLDHPHQAGIWLTYEKVNQTDFWNNSAQAPANKQGELGAIMVDNLLKAKPGKKAWLLYTARWKDRNGRILLQEITSLYFKSGRRQTSIIRHTTLTAIDTVVFGDAKDGLMGMRVSRQLQIPASPLDTLAKGNYLASTGLQGNAVWGQPAQWVMLYGPLLDKIVSVVMYDHPGNPGYPAYWHARGYGLFAANNLARQAFNPSLPAQSLTLMPGASTGFRYKLLLHAGDAAMPVDAVKKAAQRWAKKGT
ncbi:MAG TPA: PmoA family protein [Phnomibacter sp.]|nr:PmoA family protein [Phnomibacter sp.]